MNSKLTSPDTLTAGQTGSDRVDATASELGWAESESADPDERDHRTDMPALSIELSLETDDTDPPMAGWVEEQMRLLAEAADIINGSISIGVVGDERMAELHEHHLQVAGPTDVLTFDLRDDPADPVDGDVVIGLGVARRQATQRGHVVRQEVLLYALHGMLHLIGYDDTTPETAIRMHEREDELLRAVGIGPIYRNDADQDRADGSSADGGFDGATQRTNEPGPRPDTRRPEPDP